MAGKPRQVKPSQSPMSDSGGAAPMQAPPPVPPVPASSSAEESMVPRQSGMHRPLPSEPETAQKAPASARKLPILGQRRPTLDLGDRKRAGYTARWINDEPGRVDFARECGWEYIIDDKTKEPTYRIVDKLTGMKAYAMEIPKDLYDEAFFEKQLTDDQTEAAIQNNAIGDRGYRPVDPGTNQPRTKVVVHRGEQPSRDGFEPD